MSDYISREAALRVLVKYIQNEDVIYPTDLTSLIQAFPAADVRPVVVCANCEHNNHCLTQEFVDDCGKIPLDRNTFFCADGERRSNA